MTGQTFGCLARFVCDDPLTDRACSQNRCKSRYFPASGRARPVSLLNRKVSGQAGSPAAVLCSRRHPAAFARPMLAILAITGPIFILIAVGVASVRLRVLAATDMRALGVFVINFALPALLFRAVSSGAVSETVRPDLLLPYALGSLAVVALVVALAMTVLRRKLQMAAVLAMGMSVSNSAFIGFPIAQQLSPASASAALAVDALVEALIMFPLLMALAELGGGGGGRWPRVLRGIALSLGKNPMILAILAGLACSLLALQVPLPLAVRKAAWQGKRALQVVVHIIRIM